MPTVTVAANMNATFARAFNSRSIEQMLTLYEPGAMHRGRADGGHTAVGIEQIRDDLEELLLVPGTMVSDNVFCLESNDLALLRADWRILDGGAIVASGSTCELVRRQGDGSWRYVIDHAQGADGVTATVTASADPCT